MITKDELLHRLEEADFERSRWGNVYRLGDILPEADEHIGFRSWIHEVGNGAICLDALHVAEGVLAADGIWGEDINNITGLTDKLEEYLSVIDKEGMLAAVSQYIGKAE